MAANNSRFVDLCRLCAAKTNIVQGINIFDSDANYSRQIYKKIETCLPIHVSETDELPKMICDNCLYKTELLFEFRERVARTQGLLMELFKELTTGFHLQDVSHQMKLDVAATLDHTDLSLHTHNGYDNLPHVSEIDLNHFGHRDVSLDNIELSQDLVASDIGLNRYEEITYQDAQIIQEPYSLSDITLSDSDLPTHNNSLLSTNHELIGTPKPLEVHEEISNINSDDLLNFDSKESLSTQQDEVNLIKCIMCFQIFIDQLSLERHEEEVHSERKVIVENQEETDSENNDVLSEVEEIKLDLEERQQQQQPQQQEQKKMKECVVCGKMYKTNYKLSEHMRKHTGEKPYKCSQCDKAFRSKIGLEQHEASHSGKYTYSCTTCGKGFQNKSYLMVHQRVHSTAKPFICATCGSGFKTKHSLTNHINRHLGLKPFTCDICGRGFITNALLKAHQSVHTGLVNKRYKCNICEKMFVSKNYLQTHTRIHKGERPFKCEVCGKGFSARVDLKLHFTMHTGEKPYVCEICGKAFARSDALKGHQRSHTGERPYKCDICGQCFTQYTPMAIHKRLHTGERPYECEFCDKKFISKSTMRLHSKKHLMDPLQSAANT